MQTRNFCHSFTQEPRNLPSQHPEDTVVTLVCPRPIHRLRFRSLICKDHALAIWLTARTLFFFKEALQVILKQGVKASDHNKKSTGKKKTLSMCIALVALSTSSDNFHFCPHFRASKKDTHCYLCRIHKSQSKIVAFNKVQVVHNLIKQLLSFGFFLKWQENKSVSDL